MIKNDLTLNFCGVEKIRQGREGETLNDGSQLIFYNFTPQNSKKKAFSTPQRE